MEAFFPALSFWISLNIFRFLYRMTVIFYRDIMLCLGSIFHTLVMPISAKENVLRGAEISIENCDFSKLSEKYGISGENFLSPQA